MSFTNPSAPNVADYTTFLRIECGIDAIFLPDNSIWITTSLAVAIAIVNDALLVTEPPIYTLSCYNLGADRLINFAQDEPGKTYFTDLRRDLKINAFTAGVVQSSGDQGTSQSLQVPDWAKGLTLLDLQSLKTPWGRNYLAFAQSYGSNLWGLS